MAVAAVAPRPSPAVVAPPAEAAAPKDTRGTVAPSAATTIRVELEKIDRVVNMVGEIVIAQAMLGQVVQDLPPEIMSRVAQRIEDVFHHTRELENSVMAMRAQPVPFGFWAHVCDWFANSRCRRAKRAHLESHSVRTTEVDKTVIERLSDPLTHIIRNSMDHGIENAGTTRPRGREAGGRHDHICSPDQRSSRIVIEIKDDGAGIRYRSASSRRRATTEGSFRWKETSLTEVKSTI